MLNQLGRILFLKRQYAKRSSSSSRCSSIDPEDLTAHYNLMLCYTAPETAERAQEHEALYERFKADEVAQASPALPAAHPEDNNERQSVHEHGSALGDDPGYPKALRRGRRQRLPVAAARGAAAAAAGGASGGRR